ncbi:hypothetical protein EDD85DRAFT_946549 [Armillaria nabsnona]|nr:hypothetical protein EDD85DRAFT_946549 [Armillaria nabsnona]
MDLISISSSMCDGIAYPVFNTAIRPWDVDVPMFNGLKPFCLTEYIKLPPHYEELTEGDFTLAVFTISGYKSKKGLNMASLNIQFIIHLSEYNEYDADDIDDSLVEQLLDKSALGVDNPSPMALEEEELVLDCNIEISSLEDSPMF